ncbi:MAG: DUF3515 domain-containing protein [Leucobacter sp.]
MNTRAAKMTSLLLAVGGLATLLSGCATEVPMETAVDANNPACADVIVRLPDTVDGLDRRTTNAQATGAWGDPASVLLYCGIEASGPTTDTCVSVDGVDWIIDESRAPLYRFEAYGRSPGLEVIVDSEQANGTNVIAALSSVTEQLPQERKCTSIADSLDSSTFDDSQVEEVPQD